MAPTRMKLRVRRRDAAAAPAGGAPLEEDAEGPLQSRRSSRRKANKKGPAPSSSAASSSASPPTTSSGGARPAVAAEASPDSKCPICLDRFNNLAYLDHCLHRFCFPCIQEWSHNKAECPLCKQPFASILHSVRAEDDFKEYTLQPPPPPPRATASQLAASTFLTTVAAMTSDGSTQHHLRLMLRRHLVATDQEAVRRRRRREQAASGRRSGDRVGEWEFFMHSPPLPVSPYHLNMSEIIMGNMGVEQAEEERRLDFGEPPGAAPVSRASRGLMRRLAVRQRLQREGGAAQMRGAELMAFRKALYQCGVRVRGISGNQGRQRSVTAEAFRRSSAHLNRLHAWLRRELAVLLGSHASLSDVVQRTVMARVRRSGLEDPDTIEEELRPFLLGRTAHFVHEMVSFARSSLRMEVYDQQAVYELPPSALEPDRLSTSSDGSSVIAISEEDAEEERGGRSDGAAGGSHDDVIPTGSSLSLSGWDDETPGPSYTSAEPPPPFSPAPQEPANQERGEEEECLIVGYKKPMAERTPELVQLSSDSEEEEGEKKKEEEEATSGTTEKAPPPPPPSSCLPIIPASTSGACRAEVEQRERETYRWHSGSWSESSGGGRLSVCSLSPATPDRRRTDRRKKKKKKRGRDRSGERPKRSGTFCNPNRSIFPPMMSRCSPSPLRSSADSASSPPQSPRDSSWELRLSQVSPLSSSVSSPYRSFSPLYSSPPESPPTPSYSPKRPHHLEKPGGKRKYKSRHLNSSAKDPPWRPERRRRGERERKKREKPRRRENGSLKTGSSRRSREERSPSVEIIYEGTLTSSKEQPSGHKRRRRRHRRTQLSSSPVIITLDSDSSPDDANKKTNSASSSPLSSQQTIDFSDLPSLPPAPSAGGGGTIDIGDLPVNILDRGSDGSECEAVGPSRTKNRRDNSYVDVTNVEETVSLPDTSDDQQTAEPVAAAEPKAPSGGQREAAAVGEREGSGPGHRTDPEPSSSDSCLLESILNDLNQLAPPRRDLSLNPDYCFPPEKRRRTLQETSAEVGPWPGVGTCSGPAPPIICQQNQNYSSQTRTSSVPSPPPVERVEGREVPPLLRRTSPVRSYHRNNPPPLRHKDDAQQGAFPRDVRPRRPSGCDPTGRSSPVLLGLNNHTIPPISTLKNHLHHLYPSPGGFLAYPHSSGSDYFPGLGFASFPPTESHPSRGRLKLFSAAGLSPLNSSHSSDLRPAPHSSTCGADGSAALSPVRRAAPPSWSGFSGPDSNGAAAFLPDKLPSSSSSERPAGGAPLETPDPTAGFTDSAHSALPSSPHQRPGGFLSSNTTFTSQCHPGLFHLSRSESAPQNHSDVSSPPQPLPVSSLHPSEPVPPPQTQNYLDPLNSHPKGSHRNFEQNPDNQPFDPQRGSERSALNTSETFRD